MKKIKLNTAKLQLEKEKISNLTNEQMYLLQGGDGYTLQTYWACTSAPCTNTDACSTAACNPPKSDTTRISLLVSVPQGAACTFTCCYNE